MMRVVTDDLGRSVTVPVDVKRVVSLAPSVTESVFAIGAGDKLVGDTTYCNYPEQAKAIAKVGDTMNPNMETIVALKPDVVLVSTASQIEVFTKTMEQNGIAIYVSNPTSFYGVLDSLAKLGDICGTSETAAKVTDDLRVRQIKVMNRALGISADLHGNNEDLEKAIDEEVRKITNAKATPVFVQISKEPLFTIGKGSFLNQVVAYAGGWSVTADVETAFPKLSKETAAALNPEAIILSDSEDNKEPNEAFKNSPAVKNGRIYRINPDILSRPGPRLVDAMEQIAKDLHPEKFN